MNGDLKMLPSMPDDLHQFVEHEVACGKFRSHDEVVVEGLRLLRDRERKLDLLRTDLHVAIEQLERGEAVTISNEADHEKLFEDIIRDCESRLGTKPRQ